MTHPQGARLTQPSAQEALWEHLLRPELEAAASRSPLGVIPATEGGRLFRDLAMKFGAPDGIVERVARRGGWWPWTPGQIVIAVQAAAKESSKRCSG